MRYAYIVLTAFLLAACDNAAEPEKDFDIVKVNLQEAIVNEGTQPGGGKWFAVDVEVPNPAIDGEVFLQVYKDLEAFRAASNGSTLEYCDFRVPCSITTQGRLPAEFPVEDGLVKVSAVLMDEGHTIRLVFSGFSEVDSVRQMILPLMYYYYVQ